MTNRSLLAALLFWAIWSGHEAPSANADQILVFDPGSALFKVEESTMPAVSAAFVFWSGDWKWESAHVVAEQGGPYSNTLTSGTDSAVDIKGGVKPAPQSLVWDLEIKKKSARDLYGGISFKLEAANKVSSETKPRLLPGNAGWEFSPTPGQKPIRVTFEPPPQELFFERGNRSEIRAYFVTKASGDAKFSMAVNAPEADVTESGAARAGRPDATWYSNVFPSRHAPIDLSFLNAPERPAGKRGIVRAVGDILQFEDGTPVRFWGTNITAYSIFHTPENAVQHHAKRLSKLGFNLVRIHHHDSRWVSFNIFGLDKEYTGELNPDALRRIDWWIKCLKEEGIYVWLDLHVGREFSKGEDIVDFKEISKGALRAEAKGFNYVNPDIQRLMQKFNRAYLTHVNQYTNLSYGQDPAVISYLVTNENDLGKHFAGVLLPVAGAKHHSDRYMQAALRFADQNKLDPDATWKFWEPGPSKLFTADLERKFHKLMLDDLRDVGARGLIASGNFWGEMDLSGLLSLMEGNVVDAHAYARPGELTFDPRFRSGILPWLASSAVAERPTTITEWNVEPFPAYDRAAISPHVAAIAALQGWSAVMQYAYAQGELETPADPHNYSASSDPAFLATLPIAALLYRREDVRPAVKTYVLNLSPNQLTSSLNPKNSRALRTITETSRLRIAIPPIPSLPWLRPTEPVAGAIVITDPQFDAIPPEQTDHLCSDTGQTCRNWKTGVLTIDTDRSQLAAGWIGGRTITLKNVQMAIDTPHAILAVQSLDDREIGKARNILLTATAQSVPSANNRLPYLSQPVEGIVVLKATPGLKPYALDADGSRRELPFSYNDGAYKLTITNRLAGFWILLAET